MRLVEFLTNVVSDPGWKERFCEDPQSAIRGADLSDEALRAIKSGKWRHVAYVICVKEVPRGESFDPVD